MIQCFLSDRIVSGGEIIRGAVRAENGVIRGILPESFPADETVDLGSLYLAPGLIDLHTHGGGGHPFLTCDADEVIGGCLYHLRHGVTSILPTLSASPFDDMRAAAGAIDRAGKSGLFPGRILGVHMEGPYLSPRQCGAQCPLFITAPEKDEYESLIRELPRAVRRWTYAPENDPEGVFCRFLRDHGVLPSAGHTDAIYEDVKTAADNGMKLITHLYSCTSTVTRDHGFRRPGVIESAFLLDGIFCEIIADGRHLPPELIRMILKIKGEDKTVLVSDSLALAGTEETEGTMAGTDFIIEDGVCKLKDRSAFAGSIASGFDLIRVIRDDCQIPLARAIRMMTEVPASLLNLSAGRIAAGYDADLIAFTEDLTLERVFIGGRGISL